jgi:hypothetical protein
MKRKIRKTGSEMPLKLVDDRLKQQIKANFKPSDRPVMGSRQTVKGPNHYPNGYAQ